MAHKGPHISISPDYVVNRILRINIDDFAEWPESVRHLAIAIAEELFLVAYNPFINVETVRHSVHARFERESMALAHYFANAIGEGITMFWSAHEAEQDFCRELVGRLASVMPDECILRRRGALVAAATDAAQAEDIQNPDDTAVYTESALETGTPYDLFLHGASPLITITSPEAKTDRELIIFRDSFASALAPLLLEQYRTVTLVDIRYLASSLLPQYVTFTDQDVLFLYSAGVVNRSAMLR